MRRDIHKISCLAVVITIFVGACVTRNYVEISSNSRQNSTVLRRTSVSDDYSKLGRDIRFSERGERYSVHQITEDVSSAQNERQRLTFNYTKTPNSLASWSPPELPEHLKNAHQADPELIAHIRDFWILPPFEGPVRLAPDQLPLPGDWKSDKSEQGQPTIVNRILNNRSTGFYVECGAADGVFNSNSLMFETYHHWDGILIEANPQSFGSVLEKKRRSFMLNACLSVTVNPMVANFTTGGIAGGITEHISPGQWDYIEKTHTNRQDAVVQCFPLYSILAAIGVKHVDYLSLDIEGPEIDVLKTLPLNETVIDVMSIEKRVWGDLNATKQKTEDIKNLLFQYGYNVVDILELDIIVSRIFTRHLN